MLFPYILNITSSFIVSVLLSVVFVVCVIMSALFFLIVKNLKKCVGYLEKCDFCIHNSYLIIKIKSIHILCVLSFSVRLRQRVYHPLPQPLFCFSPTVNHLNIFCYAERK